MWTIETLFLPGVLAAESAKQLAKRKGKGMLQRGIKIVKNQRKLCEE